MPPNPGRNPFAGNDSPPLIDIRYRNGIVARAVDPSKRRWKAWPDGANCWDVVSWQPATGKDYELVWPGSDTKR